MVDSSHPLAPYAPIIGDITIAWNSSQAILFKIYQLLLNVDEDVSAAIFFAIKSDRTQRDVITSVVQEVLKGHPKLSKKITAAIAEIGKLNGHRNDAIHTLWDVDWIKRDVDVLGANHRFKGKNIRSELLRINLLLLEFQSKALDLLSEVNSLEIVQNNRRARLLARLAPSPELASSQGQAATGPQNSLPKPVHTRRLPHQRPPTRKT